MSGHRGYRTVREKHIMREPYGLTKKKNPQFKNTRWPQKWVRLVSLHFSVHACIPYTLACTTYTLNLSGRILRASSSSLEVCARLLIDRRDNRVILALRQHNNATLILNTHMHTHTRTQMHILPVMSRYTRRCSRYVLRGAHIIVIIISSLAARLFRFLPPKTVGRAYAMHHHDTAVSPRSRRLLLLSRRAFHAPTVYDMMEMTLLHAYHMKVSTISKNTY